MRPNRITSAAGLAALLLGLAFSPHAEANVTLCTGCIGFNMNYTDWSGTSQTVNGIGQLITTDPAVIQQAGVVVNGSFIPSGAFAEQGAFELNQYDPFMPPNMASGAPSSLPETSGDVLYYIYNVTGNLSVGPGGAATLTFNPGGTIGLYSDSSNASLGNTIPSVSGTAKEIAKFTLLSGGTSGSVAAGSFSVSPFSYSIKQTGGPDNLFTTLSGQDLFSGLTGQAFTFLSGGTDVIGGSTITFSPTLSNNTSCNLSGYTGGAVYECASVSTEGQQQMAVPEPMSIALLGSGMCSLWLVRRRWNKSKEA